MQRISVARGKSAFKEPHIYESIQREFHLSRKKLCQNDKRSDSRVMDQSALGGRVSKTQTSIVFQLQPNCNWRKGFHMFAI